MQVHDFLFADTADDSTTGIETRHRRASEETRGATEETQTSPIQTAARAYRHQTGTTKYNADNRRSVGRHNATTYTEERKEPGRVSHIHVSKTRGHSKEKHKQHNHLQIIISHS